MSASDGSQSVPGSQSAGPTSEQAAGDALRSAHKLAYSCRNLLREFAFALPRWKGGDFLSWAEEWRKRFADRCERVSSVPDTVRYAFVQSADSIVTTCTISGPSAHEAVFLLTMMVLGDFVEALYSAKKHASRSLPSRLVRYEVILDPIWSDPEFTRLSALLEREYVRAKARAPGATSESAPPQRIEQEPRTARLRPAPLDWLVKAMLLVRDHPEWPDCRIAKGVGMSPGTLSRSREYRVAARLARGHEADLPRGFRIPEDGSVEGWKDE